MQSTWMPPKPPPYPPNLTPAIVMLWLLGTIIGIWMDDDVGQWVFITVQTALCVESIVNYRRYHKIVKRDMERLDFEIKAMKQEIQEAIEAKEKGESK